MKIVEPKVHVIAATVFNGAPEDVPWDAKIYDADGDALAEFAGRACYQSWTRPNPATATNEGYLKHILEVGHYSVLEHGSVTFYIEGISRSLTHELVRHRHFSFSQLSQRYVDESDTNFVAPPQMPADLANLIATGGILPLMKSYQEIVDIMMKNGASRKEARQTARCILPNATETKIVVTGNYRAWREFLDKRATEAADVEIRRLAMLIYGELNFLAPNIFQDYTATVLEDGSSILVK